MVYRRVVCGVCHEDALEPIGRECQGTNESRRRLWTLTFKYGHADGFPGADKSALYKGTKSLMKR